MEQTKLIGFVFAELLAPTPMTARDLVAMDAAGEWPLQLEAVVDARSCFDALAIEEPKRPTESSLIMLLLQLKEQLATGSLKKLWWCSTTDMVADGLNKGGVSRSAIMKLCMTGEWKLTADTVFHEELDKRLALNKVTKATVLILAAIDSWQREYDMSRAGS